MASSSSSSSSSTTTIESSYDVFLNFRGEDTRNTITGFLHKALKDGGINVFLDSKNLWTGESIGTALHAAIKGSKIWIPIFSERYAESKWCLNELVQIVECWRPSPQQLVLPIFFLVDPSDVRNQKKGSFAKAFQEHKNNFEPHVVNSWRDALKEVGNLKGEVVDDTTNQSEIVETVVQRVLGELISKTQLAESECLVGIDSPVKDLLSLLDLGGGDVQFVGIWGIGGIGKTTIAKAVYNYNLIISQFYKRSFISDVREQATLSMGLVSLQQRLLKDILRQDFDISNCDHGKQLIKERLGKTKVLIVLDDVDSAEQIDALAGRTNWFGKGTRVIITTRDEEILCDAKVVKDKIYKPQELNHDQSLRLFSLHAFSSEQPPDDYMQLSNDVASYSGGLPLTLEVVGSLLSKQSSIEEWEDTIKYLEKIPPEKVQKRLRISYDKLERDFLKEMFLDAACFFIGWKKTDVISIWEACGYYRPSVTISRLIQRSLIKFEGANGDSVLKMHDQIRDMGREIVLEENRSDPRQRSRIWSHDDILQVLESETETIKAKGMVIGYGKSDFCLDDHKMSNLMFLDINSSSMVIRNFCNLPPTLRWFSWRALGWKETETPCESIPSNFYHKGLVHFNVMHSKIKQAWNISPPDENKRFLKLKVLNLFDSENLSKSPNFSWFPNLEQLNLSFCLSLESLDESIGQLSKLQTLDICYCLQIMELPNSICNLKSLVTLDLSNSGIKKLPNNLDSLSSDVVGIDEVPHSTVGLSENLEELHMSACSRLEELPKSVGRLRRLRTLDMSRTNLSKLPDDFSMLSNLEELSISWNLKSFPIDLSHFNKLRTLEFSYCELLEELPKVSSSLVELKLGICNSLVRTLDISRLSHLKSLQISCCKKLKEIQGLEGAESLEDVFVIACPNLTDRKRNIHGQGTLLLPEMSGDTTPYRWCADSKGLILCAVFKSKGMADLLKEGQLVPIELRIEAMIHRKDKATKCTHEVRFEDVEFTSQRDMICIHHFKGFDWFGIPLQEKDSVVIQKMDSWYALHGAHWAGSEFWKLLRGREVHDLQKPIHEWWSPLIVADFFTWYDRPTAAAEEGVPSWLWNDTTMDSEEEEEVQNDTTMDSGPPRQHYNSTTFLEEEDDDNDEDEEEEAEEVPNDTTADSGPGQHHKSTTFLELFCFPFTFLCSPCIPRWGQGSR